jgi:uncharacterized membrane protein
LPGRFVLWQTYLWELTVKKVQQLWQYLWTSLWFLPAVLVFSALALAVGLIDLDTRVDAEVLERWPRLFGAGAAGSRGVLQVIATSMITVAGVVFSITIAVLVQASSQYSPRLLRNFMSDRANQTVLGVFTGIFVYCIVVLRTIRGGDEGAFVPSLAVLGGVVLSFVGIAFLIYFIHHIASSVQASHIVANVAHETRRAIDQLFPQKLGAEFEDEEEEQVPAGALEHTGQVVPAQRTGFIQSVDIDALLEFARKRQTVVRMERGIGDFVIEGTPLVMLLPPVSNGPEVEEEPEVEKEVAGQLNKAYTVNRQRTIHQDAEFGIRQIVDVANKALSPGINDTTTAVLCVEYLTALLVRMAQRRIESPFRYERGELRVIARGSTFVGLLFGAFDEIRRNGEGNVTVLTRLVQALAMLEDVTQGSGRRRALLYQAEALQEVVQRSVRAAVEREKLERDCLDLIYALRQTPVDRRQRVF